MKHVDITDPIRRRTLCAALGACALPWTADAAEVDGLKLDDRAEVAGQPLRLNGAGVGWRLVFKVYAIGLYLTELKRTVDGVMNCDGPRRLAILMLRDVSGEEFGRAMAESLEQQPEMRPRGRVGDGMQQLGTTLATQPRGLRKGDRMTLDWVPGVGTVVELNKHPLIEPIAEKTFYDALLNVWLGTRPADTTLKQRLLGLLPA